MATYVTHDLGERFLARGRFAPLSTEMLTVISANCIYDDAGHGDGGFCVHTAGGAAAPFAVVLATDHVYIVGGTTAPLTAGEYHVNAVGGDNENILLSASAGADNLVGGVVVLRGYRLAIGLDSRTEINESNTITAAEAYEEAGTDYQRVLVDPLDAASWVIDQDADSGDYQMTSAQVTFTAGAADWTAYRNAFLVAFTGVYPAAPSTAMAGEILIASIQFTNPVTLGNGESHPFKFQLRVSEAA